MGTQRPWRALRIGREMGDSPGRSWNGAGQGPAPSGCSTGGFASLGVEGGRREKPGCWRGPPGWLLGASAGIQDEGPCEPPDTGRAGDAGDTNRLRPAAGGNVPRSRQGREENETGPRKRGRAAARRVWGRARPEQAGDGRTGSAQPGRGFHPHCRSDGRRSAAGPAGSARRCIAALQEPPPSPLLLRPPPPLGSGGPARGTHRPRHAPLPLARGIRGRRAGVPRLVPHPEPGMPPRAGSAAVGQGRAPTGGVPWLVSTRRSSAPRGWRDRPPPSGHSLSCPPVPALSHGSSRPPPSVPLPPSPAVWPCRKPRRDARPRVGQALSPRVSREGAWAGPAGSRDRHRARARLKGAVPGGTAPPRTLRGGTVPSVVRALALPMGWAEGGDQPRVPAPSGREAGKGILLLGPAPGTRCQPRVPGSCMDPGSRDPRVPRARRAARRSRWEGAGGGRASRDRPRCQVRRGGGGRERGHGARGASAPAQRGSVPKAPALCLLWENASTVTKWRGKGGIVTASPAAEPGHPRPRPPGLGAPVPAEGSGAGVPGAVPPPGPAARLSSGGEAAAENGCSAEPAESCHGGGDGEEAAQPSPPLRGAPGRRCGARSEVPQGGGTGAEPAVPGVWLHLRRAGGTGQPAPSAPGPVSPCTCPQPPPGARRSSGGSEPRGARRKGGRSCPAARHAGGAPAPKPLSQRPVLLSV